MWTTVEGFNGRQLVQVVAAATILLVRNDSTLREVSGQVTLQRFDQSELFRIMFEGEDRGGFVVAADSVLLPTDVIWQITTNLLTTQT